MEKFKNLAIIVAISSVFIGGYLYLEKQATPAPVVKENKDSSTPAVSSSQAAVSVQQTQVSQVNSPYPNNQQLIVLLQQETQQLEDQYRKEFANNPKQLEEILKYKPVLVSSNKTAECHPSDTKNIYICPTEAAVSVMGQTEKSAIDRFIMVQNNQWVLVPTKDIPIQYLNKNPHSNTQTSQPQVKQ